MTDFIKMTIFLISHSWIYFSRSFLNTDVMCGLTSPLKVWTHFITPQLIQVNHGPPSYPYMKLPIHTGANMDIKPPPVGMDIESPVFHEVREGTSDPITPTPSASVKKMTPNKKAADTDWLSDELLSKLEAHRPPHTFKAGDKVPHDLWHVAFTAPSPIPARHINGEYDYKNIHQVTQEVQHDAHWYMDSVSKFRVLP